MDKPKTKKAPIFAYGLVIGLLVGVLLSLGFIIGFYFQGKNSDDADKENVKVYKSSSKGKKNKGKSSNMNGSNNQSTNSDSLQYYDENGNLIDDSLIDVEETYTYSGENIRVAQEQLLYVRNIIPAGNKSNFYCQTKDYDSLLVDNSPLNKDGSFKVEFWVSPVNFVGYKLSSNRLILYGFQQFNEVTLEYNPSGGLKMKYLNNEYKLNCTDDFITLYIKKNK